MFCSAVCKFSVYGLILSITFDTKGGFITLWNFVFFQSRSFLRLRGRLIKSNFWKISVLKGKSPLSFGQWKELADNTHTSCFLLRIHYLLS